MTDLPYMKFVYFLTSNMITGKLKNKTLRSSKKSTRLSISFFVIFCMYRELLEQRWHFFSLYIAGIVLPKGRNVLFGSRATVDFGLQRNELQLFDCLTIADWIITLFICNLMSFLFSTKCVFILQVA
jgi:hypothetical protein